MPNVSGSSCEGEDGLFTRSQLPTRLSQEHSVDIYSSRAFSREDQMTEAPFETRAPTRNALATQVPLFDVDLPLGPSPVLSSTRHISPREAVTSSSLGKLPKRGNAAEPVGRNRSVQPPRPSSVTICANVPCTHALPYLYAYIISSCAIPPLRDWLQRSRHNRAKLTRLSLPIRCQVVALRAKGKAPRKGVLVSPLLNMHFRLSSLPRRLRIDA